MSLQQWRSAGRPEWVIAAREEFAGNHAAHVYYRTRVPLYRDLDIVVGVSDWTTEAYAGNLLPDVGELKIVVLQPMTLVEPEDEDWSKGRLSHTHKPLLWDRGLKDETAQKFSREEDDPDYVQPE